MGLLARLFSTAPHHPTQPAEVKPDPLMQSPVTTETAALQPEPQVAPNQTDLALTTPESDLTPKVNQAFVQVIREHLALLECEPNGTICYVNDALAHLCRVSAEAMVGADFANLWRTHQQHLCSACCRMPKKDTLFLPNYSSAARKRQSG